MVEPSRTGVHGPFLAFDQPKCPACRWPLNVTAEGKRWVARCRNGDCSVTEVSPTTVWQRRAG